MEFQHRLAQSIAQMGHPPIYVRIKRGEQTIPVVNARQALHRMGELDGLYLYHRHGEEPAIEERSITVYGDRYADIRLNGEYINDVQVLGIRPVIDWVLCKTNELPIRAEAVPAEMPEPVYNDVDVNPFDASTQVPATQKRRVRQAMADLS